MFNPEFLYFVKGWLEEWFNKSVEIVDYQTGLFKLNDSEFLIQIQKNAKFRVIKGDIISEEILCRKDALTEYIKTH